MKNWKWSRFFKYMVIGMLLGSPLCFMGCSGGAGEIATGAAIGIAASSELAQAQVDAQKSKEALVAELQVVRNEMESAINEGKESEALALEDRLGKLEGKKFGLDATEYGTTKVLEGMGRDFSSTGDQRGNIMWGMDALLGAYALYAVRKNRASSKVINRLRGEATPERSKEIYAINKEVNRRLIP